MIRVARWCGYGAAVCALLLCLLLTACTSLGAPRPVLERTASIINVKIDPTLTTLGHAQWAGQLCTVTLREYPTCLAHEVRHCLEGLWHADRESDLDC